MTDLGPTGFDCNARVLLRTFLQITAKVRRNNRASLRMAA